MKCASLGLPQRILDKMLPVVPEWQSDSGSFDTVLEIAGAQRPRSARSHDDDDPRGLAE